jgi:uncharacterized iron-regulated protein
MGDTMSLKTNRWYSILLPVVTILLTAAGSGRSQDDTGADLWDIAAGRSQPLSTLTEALADRRIVLVGEHHTSPDHHRGQLTVIRHLHDSGQPVAIGLEMFRKDGQPALDGWVAGRLDEADFRAAYRDHWTYPYVLYRDIFRYARENRIPLVGLNVPSTVTRQVARRGFESLSEGQKAELENVACDVTDAYRSYIRSAFGAHGHGHGKFEFFCQAQLVWDRVMALRALAYLEAHPDRRMVLLAGSGHVRKGGIPAQIREWSRQVPVVILPAAPDAGAGITIEDADFLLRLP